MKFLPYRNKRKTKLIIIPIIQYRKINKIIILQFIQLLYVNFDLKRAYFSLCDILYILLYLVENILMYKPCFDLLPTSRNKIKKN